MKLDINSDGAINQQKSGQKNYANQLSSEENSSKTASENVYPLTKPLTECSND